MDMFLSGKRGKLLELNCENYTLIITGNINSRKSVISNINTNVPAALLIDKPDNKKIIVKTMTDFGTLVENQGVTMMPSFFEDGQYQIVLEMKTIANYEIYNSGIRLSDNFQIIGNCYIGIIEFSSDIGYTSIDIYKDNNKDLSVTIEVFPSKLDYQKDYKDIINEINDEICSLAFKVLDKTYLKANLIDVEFQNNVEYINILEFIFNDLIKQLSRITSNFKHNIINQERIINTFKAKNISKSSKKYIRTHPEILSRSDVGFININGNRYNTKKVIENKKTTSIDIYENRFVKYMINKIIKRLKSIELIIQKNGSQSVYYSGIINEKRKILENYLRKHFSNISELTGKKSMSLIFQMAPGYKEFYTKYSMLRKGLDLGEDLFKITPKKLYSLYEIWCYIKVHSILSSLGYEVEEYGILKYKNNGMYLSLIQDSEAKMVYSNNKNKLELWYNKSYNSPTTNQRPDTVLYINKLAGDSEDRVYIFDAKYRLSIEKNGIVGPMEDDINVMHRYRDAIVSKMNDEFSYKYDTFGAYVMFPYGDEDQFKTHRFYKSIDEVNVGAFPMLPGSTKLITQQLLKIINQSGIEAKSERIVTDDYDDYSKFKLENVMVVNIKDKEHLKIYLENRFFHIPVNRLSNLRLGVDYLAFYQSKRSFGEDGGIKYYSKISEVTKYERGKCSELHARKGTENDLYLRFNLNSIQEVSKINPIQSGTQLVSYTTLYLLRNAENMHELKLGSNLEIEVYKKLKSIANDNNWSIRREFNQYSINKNLIEIIDGKSIIVNGKESKLRNIDKYLYKT